LFKIVFANGLVWSFYRNVWGTYTYILSHWSYSTTVTQSHSQTAIISCMKGQCVSAVRAAELFADVW